MDQLDRLRRDALIEEFGEVREPDASEDLRLGDAFKLDGFHGRFVLRGARGRKKF